MENTKNGHIGGTSYRKASLKFGSYVNAEILREQLRPNPDFKTKIITARFKSIVTEHLPSSFSVRKLERLNI